MSGTFEDANYLVTDISNAYRNQMFPDVTFVLSDGVTIQSNRYMLAWRSKYFANKLIGLKEEDGEVVMNCDSKIFQLLLDYVWEGRVDFSNLELKHLLDLMVYARITCLERLDKNIQEYLSHILEAGGQLDIEEYWTVLEFCSSNGYEEIQTSALKFIDKNFNTICSSKAVSKLSSDVIFTLLENKNRTVKEIDVFNALTLWLENQTSPVEDSNRTALLSMVNLTAMKPADLLRVVRKSGLYTDMDICDAFEKQINLKNEDGAGKLNQTQDGRVRSRSNGVASGMEKSQNLAERNMSSSMPPSLFGSILDSNCVGSEGGENKSRSEDDNIDYNYDNEQEVGERGNRSKRLASEDYKSQDEDLDTTDKDLDEKASPRRESSLAKWWRSRDSLLSPKAL